MVKVLVVAVAGAIGMGNREVPIAALQFDRGAPTPESYRFANPAAPAQFDKAGADGALRKFAGVAYSGDVIEGHWYWDRVVFDLSTTKAPAKLPMLMGHDRDKIVGHSEKVSIGAQIDVSGLLSSTTQYGKEVAATSDEGFPWQMSVHIEPRSVEEVKAGATVVVNGRTFSGPINVFRNNVIREISFTPTGWDSQTSAVAMSHGAHTGEVQMNEKELQALQARAAQADKFEADAKAAAEAKAKAEADAAAAAAQVAAFQKKEADAAKAKRDADIKALFAACGVKHTPEAAKPYEGMDTDTFAAVDKQMREAAQKANPDLFEDTATRGASGGQVDPEALARKARELQAAASQRGEDLHVADAVRMAKQQLAA